MQKKMFSIKESSKKAICKQITHIYTELILIQLSIFTDI